MGNCRYWIGIGCFALACSPLATAPQFEAPVGEIVLGPEELKDAGVEQDAGIADAGADDAGLADAGLDAGAPACGGAAVEDGGCAACQATDCCVTLTNCAADPQCRGLYACQRACTTSACLTQCRNQFPGGVWLVSGLIICSSSRCSSACALPPRTCGGIGLTTAACNGCVQQQCCAESSACAANDSCDAFIYQCIDHNSCGSTTDACGNQCRAKYDAGMGAFETLRQCALTKCAGECAGL